MSTPDPNFAKEPDVPGAPATILPPTNGDSWHGALRKHAARNAVFYLVVVCLAGQALCTAIYDTLYNVEPEQWIALGWWQKASLLLKPLAFPLGVIAGYLVRGPGAIDPKEKSTP